MTDTTNPADEVIDDQIEEVADDQQDDQVIDQADETGEDAEDEGSQDDDESEFEEIERGDKRYKIPKELKSELMMEADYRRKTQELAEQRRAHETSVAKFEGVAKELDETKFDLMANQRRLGDLEALTSQDWATLREIDRRDGTNRYDELQREYLALPRKVDELKSKLETQSSEAVGAQREVLAKQVEEGQAILARDIPGWGPELGAKLTDFVKAEFGITAEKHGNAFMDPAMVKLAHAAFKAKQVSQKQQVTKKAEVAQVVKPVQKVGGQAPKTGLDDKLSMDAWMARREKQLAAQGRKGH